MSVAETLRTATYQSNLPRPVKKFIFGLVGGDRRRFNTGRPRKSQAAKQSTQQACAERPRNKAIVARAIEAASLSVAAAEYDLSRERVRQLCAKAGVSIRPIRKARTEQHKAAILAARPRRPNAAERFLSYVEKTETCWQWKGFVNRWNGYGGFNLTHKGTMPAQRASWLLFRGEVPPEKLTSGRSVWRVSQSCDNKLCVNPEHLVLRTQAEVVQKRQRLHPNHPRCIPTTHCKRGHEFNDANTYRYKNQRHCRACWNIRSKEYQAKKQLEVVHV